MKRIELLAPAGSLESLQAAVMSGADAVYLGGSRFSARAYASNFDEEGLKAAVDYCHIYGVKIYITLNTLIKQSELQEASDYINYLYQIGVDAVIIQDLGIAQFISEYFPDFEVHASTQMTIHNCEGAAFLKNHGFKRIVLSRELSLKEINRISTESGVETEVFVHGALCVCYSGQCLMSSMLGGRSGNRGKCAQPCRLPYTILNKLSGEQREGYLLSPKDMCTIRDLKAIVDSGAVSLKIEGRMKRPEYVAGVVGIYRRALDSLCRDIKDFNYESEEKSLLTLFNREGFSRAYLHGNTGRDMMAYNYPKNTGLFLGVSAKDGTVVLHESVSLGDGIRTGDEGFTVSKIIIKDAEVSSADKGDRVKLYPANYNSGEELYKTSDSVYMEELGKIYEKPYAIKIPIDVKVKFMVGHPVELKAVYNNEEFSVSGAVVEQAVKHPMTREKIADSIRKTGDTPYEIRNIDFESYEEGFLAVSLINSCRRELLDTLMLHIVEKSRRKGRKDSISLEYMNTGKNSKVKDAKPWNLVCAARSEQLRAALESGIENIAVDIFKRNSDIELLSADRKFFLKVPNIIKEEFEEICTLIDDNINSIRGIVTANLGILNRFRGRTTLIGDYKLNVFNSFSAEFLSSVLKVVPLSVELNRKEIQQLAEAFYSARQVKFSNESTEVNSVGQLQMVVYGKVELMVSEYCPTGCVFGNKNSKNSCVGACSRGKFSLIDRKNVEFPLFHDKYCRSYIYNSVPLNLLSSLGEIRKIGISSFRLDFTDEDYEETRKVLQSLQGRVDNEDMISYTRGHFRRGVE